jgi:hypothetical protein
MIIIAIVGTLMLLSNPAALDATTVSGTVIMGKSVLSDKIPIALKRLMNDRQ